MCHQPAFTYQLTLVTYTLSTTLTAYSPTMNGRLVHIYKHANNMHTDIGADSAKKYIYIFFDMSLTRSLQSTRLQVPADGTNISTARHRKL